MLAGFLVGCADVHRVHQEAAEQSHAIHQQQGKGLQLEADLQQLLREEMQAIQAAMVSLVPAIATGDWDKVASIGAQMQGSYILKQKLTTRQRHALHNALPADFIRRDKAFHHDAGMLAHAAEMGHPDIVNFYVYKLMTACVECHTEFASQRFPDLVTQQSAEHHH